MKTRKLLLFLSFLSVFLATDALAYDCSGLPVWKRQAFYLEGDKVQYQEVAYVNVAATSKRDTPDPAGDYPWEVLGACETAGGGGGSGGVDPQAMSIYGVWHCGNSFCDWSQVRDMEEFDRANHWIIDSDGSPAVNLVVLSFLKPMELLLQTDVSPFAQGIPVGMTPAVVEYFKAQGILVLLSMGGVTYTDSWNEALVTDPEVLAHNAVLALNTLGADGLEIDWENGTPSEAELAGMDTFIDTYNALTDAVLTLDLAVGSRYLQELSRRAAQDWLPNNKIDYINAMVPRGEPSTDQWQEHVDGKLNYNPPILPKAPAKIAVSMWLTDSRRPNANCVDFDNSSQLAKSEYVRTVLPNGAGETHGFLGYMFWAAECPATRNVCTTPPNGCEGGMGAGAAHFKIQPLDFSALREN
ncbi:MAG TPA: glycosyl hydrolase family 18 protein [Xanthomonadales bacterium]